MKGNSSRAYRFLERGVKGEGGFTPGTALSKYTIPYANAATMRPHSRGLSLEPSWWLVAHTKVSFHRLCTWWLST